MRTSRAGAMMRWFSRESRGGWASALSIALASGCSGDADEAREHRNREAPPAVTCQAGTPCTCTDGLQGTTKCENGAATCECGACDPGWPTAQPYCFEPCGGDPIGAWTLDRTCTADRRSSLLDECNSALHPLDLGSELQITFARDTFRITGIEHWQYDYFMKPSSCYASECESTVFGLYQGGTAFGFMDARTDCKTASCGTCSCSLISIQDLSQGHNDWVYEHVHNALLAAPSGDPENRRSIDYCVRSDELWIRSYFNSYSGETAYIFRRTQDE
jgi:hypothetical protein